MRAKKVNENLDFERGVDPKAALGVGTARGGEFLFNAIWEESKKIKDLLFVPKSVSISTGWDWSDLQSIDGSDSKKSFKLVLKEFISLYSHREIYIILMASGNVYFYEDFNKKQYYPIKNLADFLKYFNKKSAKKGLSKNIVKENTNFERGKDPKSAMSIGRANLNYFQNIVKYSTPFEQLLEEMVFTTSFEDQQILEKAAKILGVDKDEVRIACNEYDEPISASDIQQHSEDHEWTYYNEDETDGNQLIQASTLEIYVVHREYNDLFLMLLGTIY